ncbi:MAG TPA: hypothetical protein VMF08_15700 [Candidatus Sulfotelmatobacter sp.]|nr:hypothetical protein [Candidatus Sulfotelmatobacter sp.]
MEQLRHGMVGALNYVGGHELFFNHPADGRDHECRSSFRSHVTEDGMLNYEVGLSFRVRGKPGENWQMTIAYEPDDTYTVWLSRNAGRRELRAGLISEVLASMEHVNGDDLQHAVESIYDEAAKAPRGLVPVFEGAMSARQA